MTNKTFSLIGAGRMGQNHLRASLKLGYHPKAIYDLNADSLKSISTIFDSTATLLTTDYLEFLECGVTNIAAIATTAPSHADLVASLAENGQKLIVSEKPLTTSTRELSRINEIVTQYSLRIAVNHQMRFMDQYREVKRMQKIHKLGQLRTMSVNGANFGLGMNATHYIEAFHWLEGTEIQKVSGRVSKQRFANVRGASFFDYAGYVVIESASGAVLFLDFQEEISHQVFVVYNFEFGKISVNELIGSLTVDCRFEDALNEPTFRYGMPNNHLEYQISPTELVDSTSELYEAFLGNGDYPNHLDGERTVRSAIAALYSSENDNRYYGLNLPEYDLMENLSWP